MTGFPVVQRDTFFIRSGPVADPSVRHLFVVTTDPGKNNSVLLVNVSTVHPQVPHDSTCYLWPTDHSFIKTQSYVVYAKAMCQTIQRLQIQIAAREITVYTPMPQAPFARIVAGIFASPHMAPNLAAFQAQYG